jgi:tRNA(fMet)-specific endonuclease VapC
MKSYLFDTNILVHYCRQMAQWDYINEQFNLADTQDAFVSVISWGELYSLAVRNHWKRDRIRIVDQLEQHFIISNIYFEKIIRAYGTIDAYSQGKLPEKPLPKGVTARNMGKNDLWIAATAHALDVTLLTTDNDFDHLQDTFIKIDKVVFPKS